MLEKVIGIFNFFFVLIFSFIKFILWGNVIKKTPLKQESISMFNIQKNWTKNETKNNRKILFGIKKNNSKFILNE